MYVEYVSVSVRVFVLLFICALCPNPELLQPPLLPTAALPPPLSARLLVVAATTCCCLLLLLRLLLSAIIVYVCVRMCAIRYGSTFWFLLLSSFIASLARSLSLAVQQPSVHSIMQRRCSDGEFTNDVGVCAQVIVCLWAQVLIVK